MMKFNILGQFLSFLLYITNNENRLNVIDYGGSLGTSYFQNLKFLNQVDDFRWNIVEQEAFVKIGKEYFSNENLFFTIPLMNAFNQPHRRSYYFRRHCNI